MLECCGRCSPEAKSTARAALRGSALAQTKLNGGAGKILMTYFSKIAKAAPEMMANRSDRRLPNLLVTQAHHEADYVMRRRRADSIRTRTRIQGPSKVGYMRATSFSNRLQDKPSAEAGSIYAIKGRGIQKQRFSKVGSQARECAARFSCANARLLSGSSFRADNGLHSPPTSANNSWTCTSSAASASTAIK